MARRFFGHLKQAVKTHRNVALDVNGRAAAAVLAVDAEIERLEEQLRPVA